ncbi:MAG: hypothetical protein WDN69_13225 [Aliidongia sp.]
MRVFTGQARFERHLTIALAGIFAYSLTDEILKYVGFALSLQGLLSDEYLVMWVIIAVISFGHLQQIAPPALAPDRRRRRRPGHCRRRCRDPGRCRGAPEFRPAAASRPALFPELRLAPPQTDDQFFDEVGKLRDTLQSSRKDSDR